MQSWDTRICLVRDGGIGPLYVDALYEASGNLGRIVVESIRAYQIEWHMLMEVIFYQASSKKTQVSNVNY